MHISRSWNDVLRIYAVELTETGRELKRNITKNRILYVWFSVIVVFSVIMAARMTVIEANSGMKVDMKQLFFAVFFLFLMKAAGDFHRKYITSKHLEYIMAAPTSSIKVSISVFNLIFWTGLGLWAVFSSSYIIFILIYGGNIGYPLLYLNFTMGIILSEMLGASVAIWYFGNHRGMLLPAVLLISALWFCNTPVCTFAAILFGVPYLLFGLMKSKSAFGYSSRKKLKSLSSGDVRIRRQSDAVKWKEMIVLWRDRLIISFLITSVIVGLSTGYIAGHMDMNLFPSQIRHRIAPAIPEIMLMLGAYITAAYSFVFPGLNLFLSEERTIWLLKSLPIGERPLISGKVASMLLPFIASIPFPFYYMVFQGPEYLAEGLIMLVFALFTGIAVSLPFGIKYAGRKSDVLLLYTVSVLFFALLSVFAYAYHYSAKLGLIGVFSVIFLLDWSAFILWLSFELSSSMLSKKDSDV